MEPTFNLENVLRFMKENNYTEQSLSKAMGISYSYLFRVLRSKRQPGRKFFEGLMHVGMPPEEFFLQKSFPKGNTKGSSPIPDLTSLATGTLG